MMTSQLLESLKGEKITLSCLDRKESVYYGDLLEVSDLGAVVKYLDHGREFIEFIPLHNISSISHRVLGK